MAKIVEQEQRAFMTGNEVCAWGALAAGADIMYGYPITPQNEIMHYWTKLGPKFEKSFLQTEDEISAGFTTLGGVLTGKRAFSATAGPGNVLMQESIGMAEMMRIPGVWYIQQRGGPSTATVIYAQQETTLTCYGGNGEGNRIVYSTATHQELFDYSIKAFNSAWKYRFPTFILGDGYQAKMRESVTLYNPEDRGIKMVPPEPFVGDLATRGGEARHMRNCLNVEEELFEAVMKIQADYDAMTPEILEWSTQDCEDADAIIVAHGVVSRAAAMAAKDLRKAGKKVGFFRPITIRPFPAEQLRQAAKNAKCLLVTESAYGQLLKMVRNEIYGMTVPIKTLLKPGEGVTAEEIVETVSAMKL